MSYQKKFSPNLNNDLNLSINGCIHNIKLLYRKHNQLYKLNKYRNVNKFYKNANINN